LAVQYFQLLVLFYRMYVAKSIIFYDIGWLGREYVCLISQKRINKGINLAVKSNYAWEIFRVERNVVYLLWKEIKTSPENKS